MCHIEKFRSVYATCLPPLALIPPRLLHFVPSEQVEMLEVQLHMVDASHVVNRCIVSILASRTLATKSVSPQSRCMTEHTQEYLMIPYSAISGI